MLNIFAHSDVAPETGTDTPSLLTALTHQPTWLSLLLIIFFLFAVYSLLEKLKVKTLNRFLALIPLTILVAIVYLSHNPAVTTVVLVAGFIATFVLAFTLMKGQPKESKPSGNSQDTV